MKRREGATDESKLGLTRELVAGPGVGALRDSPITKSLGPPGWRKGLRVQTNGLVGCFAFAVCSCIAVLNAHAQQPIVDQDEAPDGEMQVAYVSSSFWYTGAEVVFLGVNAQSGGQVTLSYSDTTAPGVATAALVDGRGVADLGFAPRVWIGRQLGENWGLRGSFFSVSSEESRLPQQNPVIPNTGTNFATFTSWGDAELTSVDLDIVRSFNWSGDFKLDVFGGARYSAFDVASGVDTFGVFTTGNFVNVNLQNNCQFDGIGPTLGFSSRTRLGSSSLFLLWSGRGSVLFGEADMFARAAGAVSSSPSAPLVGADTDSDLNAPSTLNIIESQLGVQYEFEFLNVPFNYFVRCAFEFQHWNVNNSEDSATGFGGTIGELTTNSTVTGGSGSATLIGLSVATGFTW